MRFQSTNCSNKISQIAMVFLIIVLSSPSLDAGFFDWITGKKKAPSVKTSSEPSKEDLIRTVRNHVSGKTYTKTIYQTRRSTRYCSQYQVDLDPNAKRNPELAKCPYVGATYTVTESIPVKKRYRCKSLPGTNSGWHVRKIRKGKWRVSVSGSTWDLTSVDSKSVKADVVYIRVGGSRQTFLIRPHQDC